jgi:cation:H+ antiporter
MYGLFVVYILAHENDVEWVHQISDQLQTFLKMLPAIGTII